MTNSILSQVRGSSPHIHPAGELLFMQKLGAVGNRAVVLAMLRSTSLLDDLADRLWEGIERLYACALPIVWRPPWHTSLQVQPLLSHQRQLASSSFYRSNELKEQEKIEQEAQLRKEREKEEAAALEIEKIAYLEEQAAAEDANSSTWEAEEKAAEDARRAAEMAREEGRRAAAAEAEEERLGLLQQLGESQQEVLKTKSALEKVSQDGHASEELAAMQEKLAAKEQEVAEATRKIAEAEEKERKRVDEELEKEAEAQRIYDEQRALAEACRPRRWASIRAKRSAKRLAGDFMLTKQEKAHKLHETIKIDTGARKLSYARSDVFFRGLNTVVGRAGAEAGDNELLMSLMFEEHNNAVDSDLTFEPPNFLIPTTSQVEWYAVVDPEHGLRILKIHSWPKEQRTSVSRNLKPPGDFKEPWDRVNEQLAKLGESPLLLNGFVCLRLYTGPMYFKYNTVLRGVSVPGCKAPLEGMFNDLCKGNKYTNTLHAISASVCKLSRVSKATTVYRAPGGVLPKRFWREDDAGVKGGVEMGFMSTSRSYHAAHDYAKYSNVKLLFEIKQSMVARGADISWLSMYPNEDEVLFPPLTACEVRKTRIDGSMLIVELRPGIAPTSLAEKSVDEKLEDERIAREKAAIEAIERKAAIDEVAKRRATWMSSMSGLKTSAAEAKQASAELEAARAELATASAAERAEKAEAELTATAKNLKAMRQMKQMEAEERAAAERKRSADLAAKDKMTKARAMGEYIKKAAVKQQLAEEKELLRETLEDARLEREREEATKQALAARSLMSASALVRQQTSTTLGDAQFALQEAHQREAELAETVAKETKRATKKEKEAMEAKKEKEKIAERFKESDLKEIDEIQDVIDFRDKLSDWIVDARTAPVLVTKMTQMLKKETKKTREKLLSINTVEAAVRAMAANPTDIVVQDACCTVLGALTGTGGASANKKAADAGALPTLVRAVKTLQRAALKALCNITQSDVDLQAAAKEAGAKDDWLMPASTGEEDDAVAAANKAKGGKGKK
jgi:hypothetical protein